MSTTTATASFHVLTKPTGAICNFDCKYCFFLSKEELYPNSRFRMTDEVLERYIRQQLEAQQGPEATIAWQGGEPTLMGLDFFRRAVELAGQCQRPGQTVQWTIQTNGTLLDDDWGALLREHKFLVGLSLDGPRAMHDAYRVDKGGHPTFDKVVRAWRLLQQHRVDVNLLCTVNAAPRLRLDGALGDRAPLLEPRPAVRVDALHDGDELDEAGAQLVAEEAVDLKRVVRGS